MQPICTIDLTTSEAGTYVIPEQWQRDFLGGASLAARLLYKDLTPELDPLEPKAPLLFMNGPLTGTAGPAVGRFVVCGRSPYTGLWGESNVGGFWGPELRKTGFDGLWLTGRAQQPVYLWIHDDKIEIRPAGQLWGLDTYETQRAVAGELGEAGKGASILVVGPAAEKGIRYAMILTDHGRIGGRTGMGALMASKNLKAIAVRGTGKVPVANPVAYAPLRTEANRALRADPVSDMFRELGTAGGAEYFDYLAIMPKKYYTRSKFDEELRVSGAVVKETILDGVSACHACVIACGRVVRLPNADGIKGERQKGPEYETLMGFGPNLWLNDAVFATRMGDLCDRAGVDVISLSGTIGLAFRLFELGKITLADTGGMALEWGNPQAAEWCVRQAIQAEGFGAQLALGSRLLGRHFGAEEEAIQVNGLETAYHDPRGASGMALVYATSPRGACHNQSDYFFVELGQVDPTLGLDTLPRHAGAEKARNVARHQDWRTLYNSLVVCNFSYLSPTGMVELINAASGTQMDETEMLRCGERGWTIKRLINHRLGLIGANDTLPRLMLQPYVDDPDQEVGKVPNFAEMLKAYYEVRGWEADTGRPGKEKLEELGLADL